jgi:hypothetical protein
MYVQAGHTATSKKDAPVTNLVEQTNAQLKSRPSTTIFTLLTNYIGLHPTTSFGLVQLCVMI